MVRWLWQNRLVQGGLRLARLFVRWVLVWLSYLASRLARNLRVTRRIFGLLVRPKDPNNLFLAGKEASHETAELTTEALVDLDAVDPSGRPLLWSDQSDAASAAGTEASALSLWKGSRTVSMDESSPGAEMTNQRYAYIELLSSQIKRLSPAKIQELDDLIRKLARKWLDLDQRFEDVPRRTRLDVRQTMRYNIPRYAGMILNFRWGTKERPVPQLAKPAKILVIGDVSHSMVHYVSVVLYFMHQLNFHFLVDSYVFSEKPTHSAPFLNGPGTFGEKVRRLVAGAKSWNAGTRFGSALKEIADLAHVDEYTQVIIATDGKVSLNGEEPALIERYMGELRRRAKQVVFLTPSAEFSDGAAGRFKPQRLGSFKYDFVEVPIFAVGPPVWYGTLGRYADRLYLIRTVQDLVDMTEDLIVQSKS